MATDGSQSGFEFRKRALEIGRQRGKFITWSVIFTIFFCLLGGWTLIIAHSWVAVFGVPLLAEAIILSAYLRHECAHLLAFRTTRQNVILGEILSWITGDLSSPFVDYRQAHLQHHSAQVDLIGFDLSLFLKKYNGFWRALILTLEAFYVPVIFLIVRIDNVLAGFCTPGSRLRCLSSIGLVSAICLALVKISPIALILYISALVLKIHCIRFVDAFQHNYDQVADDAQTAPRGWTYEQCNTFSIPVLKRYRLLNMLLLNFGFHNAHHAVPGCPWYNLPRIDQVLRQHFRANNALKPKMLLHQELGLGFFLRAYHQNRVNRITNLESSVAVRSGQPLSTQAFMGTFTDNLLG